MVISILLENLVQHYLKKQIVKMLFKISGKQIITNLSTAFELTIYPN